MRQPFRCSNMFTVQFKIISISSQKCSINAPVYICVNSRRTAREEVECTLIPSYYLQLMGCTFWRTVTFSFDSIQTPSTVHQELIMVRSRRYSIVKSGNILKLHFGRALARKLFLRVAESKEYLI